MSRLIRTAQLAIFALAMAVLTLALQARAAAGPCWGGDIGC